MTDREKLIELFVESAAMDYKDSAEYFLANGVTFQKWIPVTERLPEKGETVIALGSRGGVYSAQYKGSIYWHKLNARNHMCQPTHWMPLPEPPGEG